MVARMRVGFVGCGNILPQYVRGCRGFEILEVAACADIDPARAEAAAQEYGIRAMPVADLLNSPDIDLVINLTVPATHAEVSLAAIRAGKHIYSEKPLALTREDGQAILKAAEEAGVRVGCAPDTFLGGGLQTARKLIDDGWIGTPIGASAFMMGHGPEAWHPNPDFFYQRGGGPVFDMGPYYLTALVHLLGPVRRLTGSTRISFPERTITNRQQRYGEKIPVSVSTHASAVLDFMDGAIATMIISFDIWHSMLPRIEIYGSAGSMLVPDPNTFGGPVKVRRSNTADWVEVPLTHNDDMVRGAGPADMAYAIQSGRPHRASGELAYHVLDLMHAFDDASQSGQHVNLASACVQPAPLPTDLLPGTLDD